MAFSAEFTGEQDLKDKMTRRMARTVRYSVTMFNSKSPKYQENGTEESWSKSLENLPIFTRKHIDLHREKCGKKKVERGGTVPANKTLKQGAKFKKERYLCSDHIFMQVRDGKFLGGVLVQNG